jgi:hypothetical protein
MNDLKDRTKRFALDVILYSRKLPRSEEFTIIRRQLIRSATSTTNHYSGWNVFLNWPPTIIPNFTGC